MQDNPELVHAPPEPLSLRYGEIWPPAPLPDRHLVPVTVTARPAVPPKPTVDEVDDPVVGVKHAYCEYTERHHAYAIFKDMGWKLPVLVLKDPDKPP